ncbi:putative T6SS immunity periplasmic lipoprotein [Trabulsiella odontotermitis]|uniref:putative T6SS immunity periplasmic lipoprotein n=1 Tax=Trabulsiella odontotermitis TaxID=379893 RepID=UPI0006BA50CC|nr:putative T6SS immunity periplasmic lipoprotein [Trabulsiella odontotermitis]
MKNITLISVFTLLLAGCFHVGDPRAKHYRASVFTVANEVCVTVQPEGDEKLISLIIEEVGNSKNKLERFYYDDAITVSSDKCVPNFGYRYEAGKAYNYSLILESSAKKKKGVVPASRIYGVDFTLRENSGKLEASTLY